MAAVALPTGHAGLGCSIGRPGGASLRAGFVLLAALGVSIRRAGQRALALAPTPAPAPTTTTLAPRARTFGALSVLTARVVRAARAPILRG